MKKETPWTTVPFFCKLVQRELPSSQIPLSRSRRTINVFSRLTFSFAVLAECTTSTWCSCWATARSGRSRFWCTSTWPRGTCASTSHVSPCPRGFGMRQSTLAERLLSCYNGHDVSKLAGATFEAVGVTALLVLSLSPALGDLLVPIQPSMRKYRFSLRPHGSTFSASGR